MSVSAGRSGRAVLVGVADTGCGIARADIAKIFDPFYTTQPSGEGTGLGLSICYSVIQQHGGTIEVESEAGHGSIFTVSLPAWERELCPAKRPRA